MEEVLQVLKPPESFEIVHS